MSNFSMKEIPCLPAFTFSQAADRSFPIGLTIPIPVITTLFIGFSPFPAWFLLDPVCLSYMDIAPSITIT